MQVNSYSYHFCFTDGTEKEFIISDNRNAVSKENSGGSPEAPGWTQLDFYQCSHCPLKPSQTQYCPLAIDVMSVVNWFSSFTSFDVVDVVIKSRQRDVHSKTSLQKALSSLLGLIMSTSDCPHMSFLKPLAHFHLPFATKEETVFRVVSMYLLNQYFLHEEEQRISIAFDELKQHYDNLQIVNEAIAARLRSVISHDAAVNAVVLLDVLSKNVSFSLDSSLKQIRYLFDKNTSKNQL